MEPACGCGAPAHYERASIGICHDCYRGLSIEERKSWIARKLRSPPRGA